MDKDIYILLQLMKNKCESNFECTAYSTRHQRPQRLDDELLVIKQSQILLCAIFVATSFSMNVFNNSPRITHTLAGVRTKGSHLH